MRLRKEYILEIAATIWAMMLGLELQLGPDPAESGREDRTFAASTHIRGITNRTVSLLCPDGFARQATAVFFGVREEAVLPNQICDALGELRICLAATSMGCSRNTLSCPYHPWLWEWVTQDTPSIPSKSCGSRCAAEGGHW